MDIDASVIPKLDFPIADRKRLWDAASAKGRIQKFAGGPDKSKINWTIYGRAFLFHDKALLKSFSGYKFGYVDIVSGKMTVIPRGIFAVAAVLSGARGGTRIPVLDQNRMKVTVGKWYAAFRKEFKDDNIRAPWEASAESIAESILDATQCIDAKQGTLSFAEIRMLQSLVSSLHIAVYCQELPTEVNIITDNNGQIALESNRPIDEPVINLSSGGISIEAGERLGTLVHSQRVSKGFSAETVADQLGINLVTYRRIESGFNTRPPDDILNKLAEILGLEPGELRRLADKDRSQPVETFP